MKRLIVSFVLIISANGLFAQAVPQLNFGLGFDKGGDLPFYVSYDFPVHHDVSISPLLQTDLNLDWMTVGVKGDYYFDSLLKLPKEWDVYGGANLGMDIYWGNNTLLDIGLQVGGRWRWNKMWALNMEFAGGTSYGGKIGVTAAI